MSQMAENNIGSLVVLKPGDEHLAGIITERGNFILFYFFSSSGKIYFSLLNYDYIFIYASKLSKVTSGPELPPRFKLDIFFFHLYVQMAVEVIKKLTKEREKLKIPKGVAFFILPLLLFFQFYFSF